LNGLLHGLRRGLRLEMRLTLMDLPLHRKQSIEHCATSEAPTAGPTVPAAKFAERISPPLAF